MKTLILFLFAFLHYSISGQNLNLSETLWNRVGECKANFENFEEDELVDYKVIDDAQNGYLKISGTYPSCGCYCSSVVAAYRNNQGNYILLQSEEHSCSWEKKLSSNKKLEDILPTDFGLQSFMETNTNTNYSHSIFYMDIDIPRQGTDTKLKLELVPLGIIPKENKSICTSYNENNLYYYANKMSSLNNLIKKVEPSNTINLLLAGNSKDIEYEYSKIIESHIGNALENFRSVQEIQETLKDLKEIYNVFNQIEYDEIILGWDRESSKFYIKEKKKAKSKPSFIEFLAQAKYWKPLC
jgi:hypothetical protein